MGRCRGGRWLPLDANWYPERIFVAAVAGTTFVAIAATTIRRLTKSPEKHGGQGWERPEEDGQARRRQDVGGDANTAVGVEDSVRSRGRESAGTLLRRANARMSRFHSVNQAKLRRCGAGFLGSSAHLKDFRITDTIGAGGMGTVRGLAAISRSRHRRTLEVIGRHGLAIKVVKEGCSSSIARRSIANEILVLQSLALASPQEDARNIVRVVSLGTAPCSIVMERLPGDLHEVLAGSSRFKRWSTGERVTRIMTQIVEGLDYLHRHGWTHADLKPANVLVNESLSTVKISDFGISGRSGKEKSHGGTRVYTAPEAAGGLQKRSVAKVLDPTMDAFSVGLVLLQVIQASVHPVTMFKARDTAKVLEDPRALQVFKLVRPSLGMLSKVAFPEQRQLAHPNKVMNVLRGLLHRDPRRRLSMAELQKFVVCKGMWVKGKKAPAPAPAPRLSKELTELKRKLSRPMEGPWWESKDAELWWLSGDIVADKTLEAKVSNV